jgi:CRP-like cAMP-binding protein
MANISRHHVNRILAKMRSDGWIDARYNRIRLLDVPALKEFAWTE